MKFQKTINLWENGIQAKIQRGELKLQTGQWCFAGRKDKRCRFIAVSDRGIFNVVHWQGTAAKTQKHFEARLESHQMEKLFTSDREAWNTKMAEKKAAYLAEKTGA